MKLCLLTIFAFSLLAPFHSQAASEKEVERFVSAFRKAFDQKDVEGLMALTCWDRVSDETKEKAKTGYGHFVKFSSKVTGATLIAPKPGNPYANSKGGDASPLEPNLSVSKMVKVTFQPASAKIKFTSVEYPVGEKEGTLFLIAPAPKE